METTMLAHHHLGSESSTVRVSSLLNPSTDHPSSRLYTTPYSHRQSLVSSSSTITAIACKDDHNSSLRKRYRAPGSVVDESVWAKVLGSTPNADNSSSWFGGDRSQGRCNRKASNAEELAWGNTEKRVATAIRSIAGTTLDVGHEVLLLSSEVLEFAPIPGLQCIARTLLLMWDSAVLMDMNRLQCRRITERCAEMLISIRQDIYESGDRLTQELSMPLAKLSQTFDDIVILLQKQIQRPFLNRYLKREETHRQLAGYDLALHDALGLFGLSIQIRTLKSVQQSEELHARDMRALMSAFGITSPNGPAPPLQPAAAGKEIGLPPSSSHTSLRCPTSSSPPPVYDVSPPLSLSPLQLPSFSHLSIGASSTASSVPHESPVLPTLKDLRKKQDDDDAALDMADLRCMLRTALSVESDAEMLDTLDVKRDEMAEAIKTLQRALENYRERHGGLRSPKLGDMSDVHPHGTGKALPSVATAQSLANKTFSVQAESVPCPALGNRSRTISVVRRLSSCGTAIITPFSSPMDDDTLEQEFMESGIDALRRMSRGSDLTLPSWTITRFEVDREAKIGRGFFSDVFKGTWRGRTVAIKVLADTTPRNLFVREVEIWKGLSHPNVLTLYGASSATSDPPWFFVSPYAKNGSLAEFLRRVDTDRPRFGSLPESNSGRRESVVGSGFSSSQNLQPTSRGRKGSGSIDPTMVDSKGWDLLKFMSEIAQGMDYLHANGVLHGDLKASNVLVDDTHHCLITDFGQSEMKSEAYRISGTDQPHGTLRWQAPELMTGNSPHLTPEVDIYAFAMCCTEILSMGRVPWGLVDDTAVRHYVTRDKMRPIIPNSLYNTPELQMLINACWHCNPYKRPPFVIIAEELATLRDAKFPTEAPHSTAKPKSPPPPPDTQWRITMENYRMTHASPEMRHNPYRHDVSPLDTSIGLGLGPDAFPETNFEVSPLQTTAEIATSLPREEERKVPEQDDYLAPDAPRRAPSVASATSSEAPSSVQTDSTESRESLCLRSSTQPVETRGSARDERRYRLLLSHKFHPSLTLPLWSPSRVYLGAVGYLSKPEGRFVTLFNAISPERSPKDQHPHGLPKISGYGDVKTHNHKLDTRNAARRGIDALTGIFRKPDGQSRYSHPLRAGHKTAFLYTESTNYEYLKSLDVAKIWFRTHADQILAMYGPEHDIQKEELFLVIGTLNTSDYALFVSHNHPDGESHFNLLPPQHGKPWGVVKTDTHCRGGPSYHEPVSGGPLSNNKISKNGDPEATVLIGRLRFKPDVEDPTSL